MKVTGPLLMAAAGLVAHARAVHEGTFEGNVLVARQANWQLVGCFKSAGSLTLNGTSIYQTSGACEGIAQAKNAKVIALTNANTCYYGSELPSASDKTSDGDCDLGCLAYPQEKCGGSSAFTVWANGDVAQAAGGSGSGSGSGSSSDAAASTTTPAPVSAITVVAGGASTIFLPQTGNASPAAATVSVTPAASSGNNSNKGSNTGGIIAGAVVGVVGAIAIAGGIFFWYRSKKHREQAAELQRQNSIAGLRSEKPPSTYSTPDSRLEPAYMRRMSDGSIADNQDYSRRILKVTNPDGR